MAEFTNKRFKELAGLLTEQADFHDDMDKGLDSLRAGDAQDDDDLPSNLTTVGELKAMLAKYPDDMHVGFEHEFGTLSKVGAYAMKDQYYKPTEYGGDWHSDNRADEASGPHDVVAIIPG